MQKIPFEVNPVHCVDTDLIRDNARENISLIDSWLQVAEPHNDVAWLMSGGPTLRRRFEEGFFTPSDFQNKDSCHKIICVKHSLPVLRDFNVVPYVCVTLDPRPIKEKSTHGILRQNLYEAAHKDTIFLVASMTDPSVTKFLLERGNRVVGWHVANGTLEGIKGVEFAVGGGSCASSRALYIADILGFRKQRLVGYDGSYLKDDLPSDLGPKTVQSISMSFDRKYLNLDIGSYRFYTTGELAAQAQDLEKILKTQDLKADIAVVGTDPEETLMGALYDAAERRNPVMRLSLHRNTYQEILEGFNT